MRLLQSKSLELEEFIGQNVPPYAILSHTWGDGEVSFQDLQSGEASKKAGYQKIQHCCEEAAKDGFEYAWVDTCCIDKTSSSELSEAINSMYRWYQESGVCYVYLSDVSNVSSIRSELEGIEVALTVSRWFTRGWTLQELIAPSSLIFFNDCWEEVGTKTTLQSVISRITGIQLEVLSGGTSPSNFSIAQRMSWAAHRKTTRVEDIAYCLMGLFGVNMPMLYGEGDRAFIRLQEEIMRISDDDSIFAWKAHFGMGSDGGLLAHSPSAFEGSGNVIRCIYEDTKPFTLTNKGIRIQMRSRVLAENDICTWIVVLNCEVNSKSVGLCLKRTSSIENRWVRDRSEIWIVVDKTDRREFSFPELYVKADRTVKSESRFGFGHISIADLEEYGFSLEKMYPMKKDQHGYEVFGDFYRWPNLWHLESKAAIDGVLQIGDSHGVPFLVILKITDRGELLVNVEQTNGSEPLEEVVSSYNPEYPCSSKRRIWRDGLDRTSWEQPNGTRVVSVAIKRKIINHMGVQAVVITGHAPL